MIYLCQKGLALYLLSSLSIISTNYLYVFKVLYSQKYFLPSKWNSTYPSTFKTVFQDLCEWLQLLFFPFWAAYIFPSYSDYSCQWEWRMPLSHSNIGLERHLNPKDSTVRHPILNTGKFAWCLITWIYWCFFSEGAF